MASNIASSHCVWPLHGGKTGALIRVRDWSATPLGNSGQWPERLRAIVDTCLDAPFASFVWWGPELIQLYNDAALPIVQSRHPAVFGIPASEAWPEAWPTVGRIVERVMNTGQPALNANIVLTTPAAGLAEISFSCSPLGDAAGVFVTAFDKTETVRSSPPQHDPSVLEAVDRFPSTAFDAISRAAIKDSVWGNNLARWTDLIVQEDRTAAATLAATSRVRSVGAVTCEYPATRQSDDTVRLESHTDLPPATGDATAANGVAAVAELQHRTRNLIAVVRAIISHTLATSPSPDEFCRRIDDRLRALSRVQGLLSRSGQEPITIGALVRLEFDGSAGARRCPRLERVDIAGPAVRLRSSIVQPFALALHELAANARKYGALSTGCGQLQIGWRLEQRNETSWLVLNWAEERGRRTRAPPDRKGYGREFIEHALSYSHGAQIRFELDEMGLRCSIALPLGTDGNEERRT